MYEYIMAGNGIFIRAKRTGLTVTAPLAEMAIVGLANLEPELILEYPKVPRYLLQQILELSRQAAPHEILFHLDYLNQQWQLEIPQQEANSTQVIWQQTESNNPLIEIHSHHNLGAFFSQTDDQDESGFKIYAVLGTIFTQPKLLVRVGIYHQLFWTIPANKIFEL
jgi:PRTRC genetic system protein A